MRASFVAKMVGRASSRRLTEGEQSTAAPRETATEPATGLRKIVAIRQMVRRWQSAGTTAARASSNNASRTSGAPACASDHQHQISRGKKKPAPEGNRAYRRLLESAAAGEEEPVTRGAPAGVPHGCLAVYVVGGADSAEPERRRFVVPTACLDTPAFRQLLEKAEEEFGFCYAGGALTIPCGCDAEAFEHVLVVMDRRRKGLVDDDGNPTEAAGENGESSGKRE